MSDNINSILNSKEALTVVVEAVKAYKARYNLTWIEAFEQQLRNSYKYAVGWYKESLNKKYFTWEQYKEFIYNYIIGNISELPEMILYYLTKYFDGYNRSVPDTDVIEIIKNQTESLMIFEQEETKRIERAEQETREIRRILNHQNILFTYEYIIPFLELEEAGKLGSCEARGKTMLLADMFNYGFILGKRAERDKKHN